jgi:hypothetical protein
VRVISSSKEKNAPERELQAAGTRSYTTVRCQEFAPPASVPAYTYFQNLVIQTAPFPYPEAFALAPCPAPRGGGGRVKPLTPYCNTTAVSIPPAELITYNVHITHCSCDSLRAFWLASGLAFNKYPKPRLISKPSAR